MSVPSSSSIWGGRFNKPTDAFVQRFTASIGFDYRLYNHDINGSIAHATMLAKVGVLTCAEREQIVNGLEEIRREIDSGEFSWCVELEDVHMNIEKVLTDRIGIAGKKLHTGRSRNDQVATDMRLWLRDEIDQVLSQIRNLQLRLVEIAKREAATIIPGLTHLQVAQPITFGHHMMAWYEMLQRDHARFTSCRQIMNQCPLGSAALAGTTYPIDRSFTASLLGFSSPTSNSLDSVSDRDFAIEFASCASTLMMHLSRFSEELILWSSARFRYIDLSDAFCTGSSIMPQKKNPDVPELVRGKFGRVFGALTSLLSLMKSQPLAYNKDNQEDKEPLFDAVDTVKDCLRVFADMMKVMSVHPHQMRQAAMQGFATATDLADYLVRKGLAFRDAHEIVGKSVAFGIEHSKDLSEFSLEELRMFSEQIDADVFDVLTLDGSVSARNHIGGTAPKQVLAAVDRAMAILQ